MVMEAALSLVYVLLLNILLNVHISRVSHTYQSAQPLLQPKFSFIHCPDSSPDIWPQGSATLRYMLYVIRYTFNVIPTLECTCNILAYIQLLDV